jgi:hypothetical protein
MMRVWTGLVAAVAVAGAAQAQYGPPRGYAPDYGPQFWQGAPSDPRARIDFLQQRIEHGVQDGSLDPHEARSAMHELDRIRRKARDLYQRDHGQLSGGHQEEIERRLDDLSRRLRWDRRAY